MRIRSYGKINLFLNIIGRRKDGYHDIETLIQRIDLFDEIEVNIDKNFNGIEIEVTCDHKNVPNNHENLCYKACKWFMEKYDLKGKVTIVIYKNIPVFGGLGGGTSNAAEIIKLLNKIYELNVSLEILSRESIILGADFPYSVLGGSILCEGIGEKLYKLPSLSNKYVVIVKPSFGFSTKDVYENFNIENMKYNINKNHMIRALENRDFNEVYKNISNTLEYSNVFGMNVIREIEEEFINLGAMASSMSGSGSCVYGMFDDFNKAQSCYDEFKNKYEVFLTKTIDE